MDYPKIGKKAVKKNVVVEYQTGTAPEWEVEREVTAQLFAGVFGDEARDYRAVVRAIAARAEGITIAEHVRREDAIANAWTVH